jgi:predicted metal-dependent hydrolase
MANSKTLTLTGIGEVTFERSRKAKYVNISVRPFNSIRVAVPVGVSIATAKQIAEIKAGWIKEQIRKMKKTEQEYNELIKHQPALTAIDAKEKITRRAIELSGKHDIPFNRVFIRNQKTRWGSCSARKNISLNIKIACLPDELMDYVILHELVHTRHHNHGRKYWQELERIIGNARALDQRLDKYRLMLLLFTAGGSTPSSMHSGIPSNKFDHNDRIS